MPQKAKGISCRKCAMHTARISCRHVLQMNILPLPKHFEPMPCIAEQYMQKMRCTRGADFVPKCIADEYVAIAESSWAVPIA